MSDVTRETSLDDGDAPAFKVGKAVNLAQLDAEIREVMNWRTPAALSVDGGGGIIDGIVSPAEDDEGAALEFVIHVGHADPDNRKISQVMRNHEPVRNWVSEEAAEATSLDTLAAKVAAGGVLDELEVHAAVTGLLRERAQG